VSSAIVANKPLTVWRFCWYQQPLEASALLAINLHFEHSNKKPARNQMRPDSGGLEKRINRLSFQLLASPSHGKGHQYHRRSFFNTQLLF
jgi:hypothetical protein